MATDELRAGAKVFEEALRRTLEDVLKGFALHGGGLRHGIPEWQVSYEHDGLRRLLIFSLESASASDVRIRSHVAATDDKGDWAQRDVGSQSIPWPVAQEMLASQNTVRYLVEQAREFANAIEAADLRPLRIGWAPTG